jgi:hypothetical protein
MRKFTAILATTATIAAGLPPTPTLAQTNVARASVTPGTPVDNAALIKTTIDAFPDGGEPLKLAISDEVVKNPSLASSVVAYLKIHSELSENQKKAIYAGLADALNKLGIVGRTATGMSPMMVALIMAGAAGVGLGIYEFSKSSKSSGKVSPN